MIEGAPQKIARNTEGAHGKQHCPEKICRCCSHMPVWNHVECFWFVVTGSIPLTDDYRYLTEVFRKSYNNYFKPRTPILRWLPFREKGGVDLPCEFFGKAEW